MSIIIRKKETGEVFDVAEEFKLEIKNTSSIFNDLGSKTVSTTLPKTPHNIKLLGFSHRLDVRDKPELKMPVIISSGSYIRTGILYESSASNTDYTFGITIAFDEGIMYEAMSDLLLTDLSNLPIIESTPEELYSMMNKLFTIDNPNDHLSVFEVLFKKESYKEEGNKDDNEKFWSEYVNGSKRAGDKASLSLRENSFIIEDNKLFEIDVPYGYGISPFIRVWYLLELIFDHFGYKIEKNPFKTDFQLKQLCVLNNTLDTIVSGTLNYKQLLPPISINDFLNALFCRFGMKVTFNSSINTVNLILLREIFRSNNNASKLEISALPDIDYTDPKQLKLSVAKNLDESDTEVETYEEFLEKYNNTVGNINWTVNSITTGGIYYDPIGGQFYQCSTINEEKKRLSSIHFDWNKKDKGLETEEITSIDEALTMLHEANSNFSFLYFGIKHQLMNSILTLNGASQETNTPNVLAFAFDMGEAVLSNIVEEKPFGYGHKYGSIFPYSWQTSNMLQKDTEGNEFHYALTLTGEYGAFKQFFKEYDAFLRHSNHTIKLESFQSSFQLSNIDFIEKKIIDNQPLLLDKFDYNLDGHSGQLCKIEARTLRLYEPYDLEKEQYIPIPFKIKYRWVLCANRDKKIDDKWQELYDSLLPPNQYYKFTFLSKGTLYKDPNPPGDRTYWFLPPTKEQYENNNKIGIRIHTCTASYTHTYLENVGTIFNPKWETKTNQLIKSIDYESWFEGEFTE